VAKTLLLTTPLRVTTGSVDGGGGLGCEYIDALVKTISAIVMMNLFIL